MRRGMGFAALVVVAAAAAVLQTAMSPGSDPTGMIYVDIARHISRGDGVAADILFPSHIPTLPSPVSLWPPLYPAAIAAFSMLGFDFVIASRVVSIVAFAISTGFTWLLGSELFDESVGMVAAILLMAWPPVTYIAAMAVSENLFVMFVVLSVWISARIVRDGETSASMYRRAAAGGLAMAGAALTRYPGVVLIAIGAGALFMNVRGGSWKQRLALTLVWAVVAFAPVGILLIRNQLVTGAFMGSGRPPDDSGLVFHVVFAVKTLVADGLKLLWRVTVIPEALGLDSRVMLLVVLAGGAALLFGVVRSSRVRRGLTAAAGILVGTPGRRFLVSMGIGYWAAIALVRSVTSFEPLNTRMMMPAYPIALIGAVAMLAELTQHLGLARRYLARTVAALFVVSFAAVILPRSVSAGGPRLLPDPPPVWVQWVANNTPPGTPIVGNRSADFNFYLRRPTYSFQVFSVYHVGNRFDRDCSLIARHMAALGWSGAYLVLHAEDGEFAPEVMGQRYGPTIRRLLDGELPLPLRLVTRHPEFAVYQIVNVQWKCNND